MMCTYFGQTELKARSRGGHPPAWQSSSKASISRLVRSGTLLIGIAAWLRNVAPFTHRGPSCLQRELHSLAPVHWLGFIFALSKNGWTTTPGFVAPAVRASDPRTRRRADHQRQERTA